MANVLNKLQFVTMLIQDAGSANPPWLALGLFVFMTVTSTIQRWRLRHQIAEIGPVASKFGPLMVSIQFFANIFGWAAIMMMLAKLTEGRRHGLGAWLAHAVFLLGTWTVALAGIFILWVIIFGPLKWSLPLKMREEASGPRWWRG